MTNKIQKIQDSNRFIFLVDRHGIKQLVDNNEGGPHLSKTIDLRLSLQYSIQRGDLFWEALFLELLLFGK